MPAARKAATTATSDTVTVVVNPGTLVYLDGEQRDGTITDVPAKIAELWERQGWATTQ